MSFVRMRSSHTKQYLSNFIKPAEAEEACWRWESLT